MNNSYKLFLIAIFFSPFYFFKSGIPQIGDYIYLISTLPIIFNYKSLIYTINLHSKELLIFLLWITFNSLYWSINSSNSIFLFAPAYYIFNFLISSAFILFATEYPYKFFNNFKNILFLNNLIIILIIFFIPTLSSRSSATFNNPNQLALYGLFLISTIQYLNNFRIPKKKKDLFIYLSGFIFVIASFSISAIATLPFFILLNLKQIKLSIINFIYTTFIIALPISLLIFSESFNNNLSIRMASVEGKALNFIVERSYDRIVKYPSQMIFGAGEGVYERFTGDKNQKNEIHSTFATILFSYGIIGISLIIITLLNLFKPLFIDEIILSFPIFFFSLFHMTLRSTFLWIFLSLFIIRKNLVSKL